MLGADVEIAVLVVTVVSSRGREAAAAQSGLTWLQGGGLDDDSGPASRCGQECSGYPRARTGVNKKLCYENGDVLL